VQRNGSTLTRFYYLKDHLGSIRMTVNSTGDTTSWDDYDAWGMLLEQRSGNLGQANSRYKFIGKELDQETGYDYFEARYYDARIGKFLSVDPLAGKFPSWSPYAYSFCNPLRFTDPSGMGTPTEDDILAIERWGLVTFQKMKDAMNGLRHLFDDEKGCMLGSSQESDVSTEVGAGVEALQRADAARQTLKKNGHNALVSFAEGAAEDAEGNQLAGGGVALAGVAAPPFAEILEPTAGALVEIGTVGNIASLGTRLVDAAVFGGSWHEVKTQSVVVAGDLAGLGLARGIKASLIRETGLNPAFRSASSGWFIPNLAGYGISSSTIASEVGFANLIVSVLASLDSGK
jgi:RHS repeat-associated protein